MHYYDFRDDSETHRKQTLVSLTRVDMIMATICFCTSNIYWHIHVYTGWLVTGGTSGKGVILREKISRKYRIKIFRSRLCFRENRLWILARYACTLSRLVITDLTVDRCLDRRYVDKHFQCDRNVFLPINLLFDFYRYPLSIPIMSTYSNREYTDMILPLGA